MRSTPSERTLGTFLGVFTPTILTVLGVIMYLRTGWLVGHVGLAQALLAIVIANSITLITTLSFSSVATNGQIGVGGAYYIVSRSLGLPIGGSIGLPLFFSQAFSVTLYSFGLAETLRFVWPAIPVQPAAVVIILAVAALSFVGANLALRTQLPLMALIGVSLIALGIGAFMKSGSGTISLGTADHGIGFWTGFAVFFPAVTGVMTGLSLSGDLRDPGRAIPRGSIMAVVIGFAIYLIVPVLLAMAAAPEQLRTDPMIWSRIAPLGAWVILPALWGAIFSSAVGAMLSAPRTLQAMAIDQLLPRVLGRHRGRRSDLAVGFAVSLAIALGAVLLGDLNAVAPVVTMFFLTVYGTLNIAAAVETLSGDPSWRPRLRVPWVVNLIGGLGCIAAMFLVSPVAGLLAFLAELILWLFLSRREGRAAWGDARRGLYEALIRRALFGLARRPMSARNWRPHVQVFVPDEMRHLDLIRFGDWFSQGRGLVTVTKLVVGDLLDPELHLDQERAELQRLLDAEQLQVFSEVDVVGDEFNGLINAAQAHGMGALENNTVLVGWPRRKERLTEFLRILRRLEALHKSLIIGRVHPRLLYPREGVRRVIHIWWGGLQRNGDLMLLLAYLLTRNRVWRDTDVQVMSIASNELTAAETTSYLRHLISEIRIDAEIRVIERPEGKSIREIIHQESAAAEVVFFGLASPASGEEAAYADRIEELAGDLPCVFYVKNSSCFIGELL